MILQESIKIKAKPKAIFQFFEEMEHNYSRWHLHHVLFRWVSGRGVQEGNVFYFEEYIAGKLLKKRVVFTRVEPCRHIEFAPTFWLLKLFLPRLVFRIERDVEQDPDECMFVAQIQLRMGPLAARLNKRELDAVRKHMKEEGENVKRILEQRGEATAESHKTIVDGDDRRV